MQFAATLLHACNHFSRSLAESPQHRSGRFSKETGAEIRAAGNIRNGRVFGHPFTPGDHFVAQLKSFLFFLFTADLHLVSFCQCPGGEHFGA